MDPERESQNRLVPDAEELSEVLSTVYDAALDPGLWPAAIEACCRFLNCCAGTIVSIDVLHMNSDMLSAWGFEPAYLEQLPQASKINPAMRAGMRQKVGEVGCIGDAIPYEIFYESEAYKTWAKPQGIVDAAQTTLDRTATSVVILGCSRDERQGRVDETLRRRMGLLVPHLRRALLIGKTIDRNMVDAAAFADTIDGLAAGVFLVDADLKLIHANKSGDAILESRDFLFLADGLLKARDSKAQGALRAMVAAAADGEIAMAANGAAILLTARTGERHGVNVLPLASGRRRDACIGYAAAAAIFVRSTAVSFPLPVQTVCDLYRLTAGEVRVLFLIVELHSVAATAQMLGLSQATVKTHLRSIFRKTGAPNQAALVKLVAGYAGALR